MKSFQILGPSTDIKTVWTSWIVQLRWPSWIMSSPNIGARCSNTGHDSPVLKSYTKKSSCRSVTLQSWKVGMRNRRATVLPLVQTVCLLRSKSWARFGLILVIIVAHNPLHVFPVYINQCKHNWSILKLQILNILKGNLSI